MKKFTIIRTLMKIIIIIFSLIGKSYSQIPNIPPSMISEFSNMTPSAQRDLANQYGIDLNGLTNINSSSGANEIGTPAGEITSTANDSIIQTIINSEDNREKAENDRRESIPIFERDYTSIRDLPIYGRSLFNGNFSTFAPVDNVPVSPNYIIGAGDSLIVSMYGVQDKVVQLIVKRDGSVDFPELGNISISGMTFNNAVDYIKNRISTQLIGVNSSISMGRLKSINVFMAGEAVVPGSYSVSGLSTVSQLLFVAGGISEIGSLRNIQVKRAGEIISKFDVYALLKNGDATGDIRLQSGDVVLIPPINKSIFIDGAVRRIGKYEIKDDESIIDLIELAGGTKSRAFLKRVLIERFSQSEDMPSIINIDLTLPNNHSYKLKDGDIIRIAEIDEESTISIKLSGAVKRPGRYGWFEGIRFTDIVDSIDSDLSDNFDNTKALIIRRKSSSDFKIEVLDFELKDAIDQPKSKYDPLLRAHDEVMIFSLGNNDDNLNDLEIYDAETDINYPSYGKGSNGDQLQSEELMNQQMMGVMPNSFLNNSNDSMFNLDNRDIMTYAELMESRYLTKKKREYYLINKGKRRVLLEPVVNKLLQQASSEEFAQVVSISGAVKVPGNYPLTDGATFSDLIDLAGGYSDNAYIDSAELRKTIVQPNGSIEIKTTDINMKFDSQIKVHNRDHLHIRNIKDWDATDMVYLVGEIAYPGSYLISPNEKLSSVIRRAGGFTSESFIQGALFTRESIKQKEREQLQILGDTIRRDNAARSMTKESEDFSVSSSDIESGIEALLSTEVYGRLIIDVPRLMNGDQSADIVLQDGDVLTIPKFTNAVTVVGEVRRSGSFVLQDRYDVTDYLQLAAGTTARANLKDLYIIRADGSVYKDINRKSLLKFDDSNSSIEAGDTIVVPIKSNYQTPLNLYSTVSQVVFQSIASIAAFSTVFD